MTRGWLYLAPGPEFLTSGAVRAEWWEKPTQLARLATSSQYTETR